MPRSSELSLNDWNFFVVDQPDKVDPFMRFITGICNSRTTGPVAVDTETDGLEWWNNPQHFVRLYQFAFEGESWAVPARGWGGLAHWALASLVSASRSLVFHHASFDMHAIRADQGPEIPWHLVEDTMLQAQILRPGQLAGLKRLGRRKFGQLATMGQALLKRRAKAEGLENWYSAPVTWPEYWAYGCVDTLITESLFHDQASELSERGLHDQYRTQVAVQDLMWRTEERGIRVDSDAAARLCGEWEHEARNLVLSLQRKGLENPGSNRMVEAVLRKKGWEPVAYTETGQAALNKAVLTELQQRPQYRDIANELLQFRKVTKWLSTYLRPIAEANGRVHHHVNVLGALTGRISVSDPPFQQLPAKDKTVRTLVLAEEGHKLVAADYDGQEARIFAALSGDHSLMDEFLTGDGDMHAHVARMVYGEGFTPAQRQIAKSVNFARIFGAGEKTIAETAGITLDEAKEFLAIYAQAFPGAEEFIARLQVDAVSRTPPHVVTVGGREIPVDPDKVFRATNYTIQGSAADATKAAGLRMVAEELDKYLLLQVHDEYLASVPEDQVDEYTAAMCRAMEDREMFAVPLTVSASPPCDNWGQTK